MSTATPSFFSRASRQKASSTPPAPAPTTWTAEDRCGNDTTGLQRVTVQDTTPPTVTSGASDLYCLWPPNHKYVCFGQDAFEPVIVDNCGTTNTWVFTGCASDQPDDAEGDGRTWNDCVVSADGQSLCVRAERDGSVRAGRRYAVSVAATDECANAGAPGTIGFIHVPHRGRAGSCIRPGGRRSKLGPEK